MEHYSQAEITPSDYDSWEELTEEIYRVHREDSASDDGDSDDLYDFFSPDAMVRDILSHRLLGTVQHPSK